jgi:hypothetical protein
MKTILLMVVQVVTATQQAFLDLQLNIQAVAEAVVPHSMVPALVVMEAETLQIGVAVAQEPALDTQEL